MTTEEKARAYDEALEDMRVIYPNLKGDAKLAVEHAFPELTESDDERIRKALIKYHKQQFENNRDQEVGLFHKDALAYLEKQKENPKSADSIPSNCVSNAKCDDRWHKVTDSLPDNGRLVLAKDCLGNVLLARYDGENWEVNVYDNEDHYCHNSISKWCEIPSEKQKDLTTENIYKHSRERMSFYNGQHKEQKPEIRVKIPKFRVGDIIQHIPLEKWDRSKKIVSIDECGYNYDVSHLGDTVSGGAIGFAFENEYELVERKPAEWSEEDEKIIGRLRSVVNECASYNDALDVNGDYCEGDYAKLDAWLKSLPLNLKKKNDDVAKLCSNEWSKEDETMLKWIEDILLIADDDLSNKLNGRVSPITDSAYSSMKLCIAKCHNWLKSLPERINLQPKQEWSEEDEACIRNLESIIYYDKKLPNDTRVILGEFLSNLRPQPQGTYKQVIHTIFGMLKDKDFYEIQPSHRVSLLNDIRVKCKDAIECAPILDEPSWKPSDEQLRPLEYAIDYFKKKRNDTTYLESLYNDLKKL